ncbi:hypothetical protein KJ611_03090 [Patescibacteria group bacterium]|nr:hypothetical protein [Patescibacteria group bacterium]
MPRGKKDAEKIENRHKLILALAEIGFVQRKIPDLLGVSLACINKDCKNMRAQGQSVVFLSKKHPERYARFLSAFLEIEQHRCLISAPAEPRLVRKIKQELAKVVLPEISGGLRLLEDLAAALIAPDPPPDQAWIKKLLNGIFYRKFDQMKEECLAEKTLEETFDGIRQGLIPAPANAQEMRTLLIRNLMAAIRSRQLPAWPANAQALIDEALKDLDAKQKLVIQKIYEEGKTLEQAAGKLAITRERVRQILASAMRCLRHPHRRRQLSLWFFTPIADLSDSRTIEETVIGLNQKIILCEQEIAVRQQYQSEISRQLHEIQMIVIGEFGRGQTEMHANPVGIDKFATASRENINLTREHLLAFSLPIENLELSIRTYNALNNCRIETIGQLVQYSAHELLKMKNFGQRSLREIRGILKNYGLDIGLSLPDWVGLQYPRPW